MDEAFQEWLRDRPSLPEAVAEVARAAFEAGYEQGAEEAAEAAAHDNMERYD